ncbi:MAG: hypothetical protein OEV44_07470 [Spirochaetota bacterium]|nr:hypothetical protein [Spirochaetota bacterium]
MSYIIFIISLLSIIDGCANDTKPIGAKYYLITSGFGIQWSKLDRSSASHVKEPWVFYEWSMKLNLTTDNKVFISSTPDGKGFIIVDDGMYVNGRKVSPLFTELYGDATRDIGRAAEVSYKAVEPIDITKDIRKDGWVHIQLIDWGVLHSSSRLYLVVE